MPTQAGASSILLLDPSGKDSLSATGNATIAVPGDGSITVDSQNAEAALAAGHGLISAGTLFVRGGARATAAGSLPGIVRHLALPENDPLASVPALTSSPPLAGWNLEIASKTVTLNPGTYVGGIEIGGRAVVYLEPGVYYLKGGGLDVAGSAQLLMAPDALAHPSRDTGTGVLIYNAACGSIRMSGQATMNLVGSTAGPYQGIALFQDRRSLEPISISGDAQVALSGTLYAAAAAVRISGNGDGFLSKLIAADLQVSGNGTVTTVAAKASPTVSVVDPGGPYTGLPYAASATVNGAATLEGVGLTLDYVRLNSDGTTTDLLDQAPRAAGKYQVTAFFPGSAHYASASGSAAFTIQLAVPTVSVSDPGGTYNGQPFPATAAVTGVSGGPGATLESVSPVLTYYVGTSVSGPALVGAPTDAGTYTVRAAFPGSADYGAASAQTTFTISPVTPIVSVSTSGSPSPEGAPVAFTATVTNPANSATPMGHVEFFDGGTDLGSGSALSGTGGSATSTLVTSTLAAGDHTITAQYTATGSFVSGQATVEEQIASAVPPGFVVGPTGSHGGGTRTADAVDLIERDSFLVQTSLPVQLGLSQGTRTLTFQVAAQFDPTDQSTASGDRFLVYLASDPARPIQTLLDGGQPGTPLFTLVKGDHAAFPAGRVRFDGSTVQIDVSSLTQPATGYLVFQLLGGDGDGGSVVHVSHLTDAADPEGVTAPVFPAAALHPAAPGAVLDLSHLSATSQVRLQVGDVHLDPASGQYMARLRLENSGPALGRTFAVVFPGLPADVHLQNPSGTDPGGVPYLNFHDAIPAGGLGTGALSDPIDVAFVDPHLTRFAIAPRVLSGGPDRAPNFAPVGSLSVLPGGRLTVALQANDPDGDPVHFGLSSPGPLPTGSLQGDGTLTFAPTPSEVGTYQLTLAASDGAVEATQGVTLTVAADAVTTTRLSGVVQDADGNPLAGVPLDVGATEVTTAADGSFRFDFGSGPTPAGTLTVHGERAAGTTAYPRLTAQLSLLLGHDALAGVNNVLARPIVLTPLDTADAVTIDPAQDTTVTTPALPGAALHVAAGTLRDGLGNPYAGPLDITEVSPGAAPVPLSDGLLPDQMIVVQPGGLTFTAPAALTLSNRAGWAAGTAMDLWALDPSSGNFTRVGAGRVSADGSLVQTTAGGVSAGTLFFFLPQLPADPALDQDPFNLDASASERAQQATFGSDVELHSGAVSTDHPLVTYQSLGVSRGLTLHYDSLRADPRPIVHFATGSLPADPTLLLAARLTLRYGNFTYEVPGFTDGSRFGLQGNENFWTPPAAGGPVEAALQAALRGQPSGDYFTELETGLLRLIPTHGSVPARFVGTLHPRLSTVLSINGNGSPFGTGWGLAGLEQLVQNPDGSILLVDGDGSELLFSPPHAPGSAYSSPVGDFSTFVRQTDGTFRRTLKDQTVYAFDADGRLATVTDRNGNQTSYQYDASDRLAAIVDPVGLTTSFTYAGNQVTITDPALRVTTLHLNGDGNLIGVTDPDQLEQQWEYDNQHHLTAEIDKRVNRDEDSYDFAGRALASQRADGSTVQVAPTETHGLFRADQTANPFAAPAAVAPAPATASLADPDGHVTTTTLDRFGQFQSATDEIGPVHTVARNSQNLVAESIDARSHETSYTYDARGNVLTIQDALSGAFGLPTQYTVGAGPTAVVAVDLNGDGAPDLATANSAGNSVSVLVGLGDGTFANHNDLPTGVQPVDLAAADINRDNHTDLVTANLRFPSGNSILLGNGDGTFAPALRHGGAINDSLALGDLNGDGVPDLVASETSDGGIFSFLATGTGQFDTRNPRFLSLGGPVHSVALADVNGDGRLDVVAALEPFNHGPQRLALAMGQGNGIFVAGATLPAGPTPRSVRVADLNGDHRPDVACVDVGDNTVSVYLQDSGGGFSRTTVPVGATPAALAVGDVDGDGHSDLVVANTADATVSLLRGNGDGTFQARVDYGVGAQPQAVALADLNHDERLDLVTANADGTVTVRLNNGAPPGSSGNGGRSFTYDPVFNEVTSATDELGRKTLYQIDPANGNVLSSTVVVAGGPHNLVTTYSYFPNGLVKTITDPLGRVTAFAYDLRGRLSTRTDAQGTPDQAITRYEYDDAGNVSAVTDPDNHHTEYHDDPMNRLTLTHDALGHDTQATYDASGNVLTTTDARGNVTTSAYDAFGRLTTTTGPDPDGPGPLSAPQTGYQYDPAGNLVQIVDSLGHATQIAYDARKRVVSVTNALGAPTRYEYDPDNNPTATVDPDGNRTTFAFDARSRLTQETDPLGHVTTYQYDAANHLVSKTDRDGRTVATTYNALDEPLTETWTGAGGNVDNVIRSSYDDAGNRLTVADNLSALAYTYTNRNQVATEDNAGTPGAPHVVLAYAYDPAGNVLTIAVTVNGQPALTNAYTPDALNRVAEITQTGSGVHDKRVDLTYNEVGLLATTDRFADLAGTQAVARSASQYDALNRLTGLVHSHAGVPVASYQDAFDAGSRITQVVSNDGTTDFSYDLINQLVAADHHSSANPAESYTYDAGSNRITSAPQATSDQIGQDNRLTSDGTFTYTYDTEGNLLERTEIATNSVRIFQWDERNRLVAVTDRDAAGTVTQQVLFTYDALDRRIAKEVKQGGTDVTTNFVSNGRNALLDFIDDDGPAGPDAPVLAMRYLTGPAVDQVFAQEDAAGNVDWLLADHLGSVRDLVDDSGAAVRHISYDSFGNVIAPSPAAIPTRFLFAGREFDVETGLYDFRARYYDPGAGRFLSEDPIGFASLDMNLYAFVRNDPVNLRDPAGTKVRLGFEDLFATRLDGTSVPLFATLEQVTLSLDQISQSVDQVTQGLEQVTQSIDQFTLGLEQVTQSPEQVTQSLEQATQSIDQVYKTLEQATQSIDDVYEGIDKVFSS